MDCCGPQSFTAPKFSQGRLGKKRTARGFGGRSFFTSEKPSGFYSRAGRSGSSSSGSGSRGEISSSSSSSNSSSAFSSSDPGRGFRGSCSSLCRTPLPLPTGSSGRSRPCPLAILKTSTLSIAATARAGGATGSAFLAPGPGALPASAFSAAGCTLVFVLSTLLASFSILLAAAALAALVWHFRSPRLAHHRPLGWCTRPNTAERKCSAVSVLYRSDTAPFVLYSSAPLQKWQTFSCYLCPRSALGLKPVR